MPTYTLPYGPGWAEFTLADDQPGDEILPPNTQSLPVEQVNARIEAVLAAPLGAKTLEMFRGAQSVAIAVNDKTRPVPYDRLLPPLLRRLEQIGIPRSAVRLFVATGTHTPLPPQEFARILPPEVIQNYSVVSHDCDAAANLVDLGVTPRGTPVFANHQFYKSELKIVTGNIEPHHFAGFSGGAKTASIGVCGRETINRNHTMLVEPEATIGVYANNPLRQDIEDIGDRIGVDFALNFVMGGEHEIADVLFGTPREVMQAGIPVAQRICQTPVKQTYDLVIASAGGQPKDINLYQAQKALTHASLLARPGGILILAAACPEGSGSASYEAYLQGLTSHAAVLEKFRQTGFKVGPHKAYQIARIATRFGIILVSDMPSEKVHSLLLTPAGSVQAAIDLALAQLPPHPRIAILPYATSTIPQSSL